MLKGPKTLVDAQITALNVDHILNSNNFGFRRNEKSNQNHYRNFNSQNSTANQPIPMDLGNIDNENLSNDAQLAEHLHAISQNVRKLLNLRAEKKCFKCQKVGHIARNCRVPEKET